MSGLGAAPFNSGWNSKPPRAQAIRAVILPGQFAGPTVWDNWLFGSSSSNAYTINPTQGTYSLTGEAQGLSLFRSVSASQGTYSLSGKTQSFVRSTGLNLTQGSYSLSGKPQSLFKGLSVALSQGSYVLSGKTQSMFRGYGTLATRGLYSLSGNTVTLTKTGITNYAITALQGVYLLIGHLVDLRQGATVVTGGKFPSKWQKGIAEYHKHTADTYKHKYPPSHVKEIKHVPEVLKAAAHMSSLGGDARAKALTPAQRTKIATKAANARWR